MVSVLGQELAHLEWGDGVGAREAESTGLQFTFGKEFHLRWTPSTTTGTDDRELSGLFPRGIEDLAGLWSLWMSRMTRSSERR